MSKRLLHQIDESAPFNFMSKRGFCDLSKKDFDGNYNFNVIDIETKKMKISRYTYKAKPEELTPSAFHRVDITEGFEWILTRLPDNFLIKPGNIMDIPIYVDPETDEQTLAEGTSPPDGHILASLRVKVMRQRESGCAIVDVFVSNAATAKDAYVAALCENKGTKGTKGTKATTCQSLKDRHTAIVESFVPKGENVVVLDTPLLCAAREYLRLGRSPEDITVVGRDSGLAQPADAPALKEVFCGEFSHFLAATYYHTKTVHYHTDFDMCGNPDSAVKMLRTMQTYDALFDQQVIRFTFSLRGFKGGKDKDSILSLFRSVVAPTFDVEALHFEYYKNNNKTKMGFVVVKIVEAL